MSETEDAEMVEVQRFDLYTGESGPSICTEPDGRYVLFDDYEAQRQQIYRAGFAVGLEVAARYTENQAKLHAERLGDVEEEPYLSDRSRWTAGHLAGVAKALRERAEWEKKRSKTIEREGK